MEKGANLWERLNSPIWYGVKRAIRAIPVLVVFSNPSYLLVLPFLWGQSYIEQIEDTDMYESRSCKALRRFVRRMQPQGGPTR